jgi:hypothetical protein
VTVLPDGSSCRTYWKNTHGCPGVVHEINAGGVSFTSESIAINQYDTTAIYMVYAEVDKEYWDQSQATLDMHTIESGILGPFVIPTTENNPGTYWLIGCFADSSMDTFQQVDGAYNVFPGPPTDACNHLFPGLG